MSSRHSIAVPVVLLLAISTAHGAPIEIRCPWRAGETWTAGGYGNYYGEGYHTGADYYAVDFNRSGDDGADILTCAPGTVTAAHWSSSYGWNVHVDHGNGVNSLYAHLKYDPKVDPGIWEGQSVTWGSCIGKCGSTPGPPYSTGSHLHFCLYQGTNSVEPSPMSGQAVSNWAALTSNNEGGGTPAAPTDLRPVGDPHITQGGRIALSWTDHPTSTGGTRRANHVFIYPWDANVNDPSYIATSPEITDPSTYSWEWTASNVAPGHYKWRVAATNDAEWAWSDLCTFWVDPVIAASPTNLGPTGDPRIARGGRITLGWMDHPMNNGQPRVSNHVCIYEWDANMLEPSYVAASPPITDPNQHSWEWTATNVAPGHYKWQVAATDGSTGWTWSGQYGYVGTFWVDAEIVNPPTSLQPADGQSVLVNRAALFSWVDHPMSNGLPRISNHVAVYSYAGDTSLPPDVWGSATVTGDIHQCGDWTPRDVGRYKWKVAATNGSDIWAWSETVYLNVVSEATPSAPSDLSPGNSDPVFLQGPPVHLSWTDYPMADGEARFDNLIEVYDRDTNTLLTQNPKTFGDVHAYDWTPPGPGRYKWRVWAGNGISKTAWSSWGYFQVISTMHETTNMGAGVWLMGLPLVPANPDASQAFGSAKVVGWDAVTQTYRLYEARAFDAVCGSGYWVIYEAPKALGADGLPAAGPVTCAVSTGWNLLGNPYSEALAWSDVDGNGKLQPFAWRQSADGSSYELVSDIEGLGAAHDIPVWRGFWVWAIQGGTVSLNDTGPAQTAPPPPVAAWSMRLTATAGRLTDTSNYVGQMKTDAALQAANPPLIGKDYVDLYLLDAKGQRQAVSLAAAGGQTTWDVCVETNLPGAEVTVRFPDLSAVPRDLALTLTDLDAGKTLNMRTSAGYSFTAGPDLTTRHLRVAATPRTGPALALSGIAVQPTRETVTVTYTLSAPAEVEVRVLNLAGRTIATIPQGYQTGGTHTTTWSGRTTRGTQVPSGRYLLAFRCTADDGTQVQQMVAATVR